MKKSMTPLRIYRRAMGWSGQELANKLGLTASLTYKIETGERKMRVDIAEQLQEMTGVPTMAWILPEKYHNPYCKP